MSVSAPIGRRAALGLALGAACAARLPAATPAASTADGMRITPLPFESLDGWARDDHAAGLRAFLKTVRHGRVLLGVAPEDWTRAAEGAREALRTGTARAFLEARFQPAMIEDGRAPLFTGYYEPELTAALAPGGRFRHPIHRKPDDGPLPTRAEIAAGALDGKGLELAWLDDPAEAYFLHVQGSGRLRLPDGRAMRVGYAGRNGMKYVSIGAIMRREGLAERHELSAEGIKAWIRRDPQAGRALMDRNPSYIFFREAVELDDSDGPAGALGVPLTPMRSAAVDDERIPLGAPVWIETEGPRGPIRQLFAAQDVGSAIKGAQRADLFFGPGPEAGRLAGRMHAPGRIMALLPRDAAALRG